MTDPTTLREETFPPGSQCRALIPYPDKKVQKKRPLRARILTFFCAAMCLVSATTAGINLLLLLQGLTPDGILLQLGNRAFLGFVSVSVTKEADMPVFPPAETAEPAETDTPIPPAVPSEDEAQAPTDPPSVPDIPSYPIKEADISCGGNVHALINETAYEPSTASLLQAPLSLPTPAAFTKEYGKDQPYILIIHTHGTEAYASEGTDTYTREDSFRSGNKEENVVAVGAVMAETFEAAGIPTLHCTEMFDAVSYQDSYSRAAAAIRAYLEAYPSIQIVLDVHRDSIIRSDMTKIRPVTTIDGESVAQFMIVVGTDYKGANHPNWEENLSFALKIQSSLIDTSPHLARAINLRGAGFNQQYTKGSLLLEVGSCGNTLEEAKRAGRVAAESISNVLKNEGDSGKTITLSTPPHPRKE